MQIDHHCKNTACQNVRHMRTTTPWEYNRRGDSAAAKMHVRPTASMGMSSRQRTPECVAGSVGAWSAIDDISEITSPGSAEPLIERWGLTGGTLTLRNCSP